MLAVGAQARGCGSALSCSLLGCFSQVICSYVLMPVAFLMGADWADSPLVAELLGIKIFLNEFVAYQQLAQYKKKRLAGLPEWDGDHKQWISVRGTVTLLGMGQSWHQLNEAGATAKQRAGGQAGAWWC